MELRDLAEPIGVMVTTVVLESIRRAASRSQNQSIEDDGWIRVASHWGVSALILAVIVGSLSLVGLVVASTVLSRGTMSIGELCALFMFSSMGFFAIFTGRKVWSFEAWTDGKSVRMLFKNEWKTLALNEVSSVQVFMGMYVKARWPSGAELALDDTMVGWHPMLRALAAVADDSNSLPSDREMLRKLASMASDY